MAYPGDTCDNATKEATRALTLTAAREWGKYGISVTPCTHHFLAVNIENFDLVLTWHTLLAGDQFGRDDFKCARHKMSLLDEKQTGPR